MYRSIYLVETHLDLILKSRSVVKINVCTLTSVANVLILDERRPTREKCKGDEIRCIEDTGNKYELCFTIDFNKSAEFAKLHMGLVVLVKKMSVLINFLLQNTNLVSVLGKI